MKKLLLFLTVILLIFSCKDDEDKYLSFILAGQINGIGIKYVDIDPDVKLYLEYCLDCDTIINIDLDSDRINDFELEYSSGHFMHSSGWERLKVQPLGMNSLCVNVAEKDWVDSFKLNDTINNNCIWSDSTSILYDYFVQWLTSPDSLYAVRTIKGYWYENDNIYMGVKTLKDNKQFFGWIDLSKNALRRYAITVPYLE